MEGAFSVAQQLGRVKQFATRGQENPTCIRSVSILLSVWPSPIRSSSQNSTIPSLLPVSLPAYQLTSSHKPITALLLAANPA